MMQWHSYTMWAPQVVPKRNLFVQYRPHLIWCLWADHAASANIHTHSATSDTVILYTQPESPL